MRKMHFYVDTSVIGGLEDSEFEKDSLALWNEFIVGKHVLVLSSHTLRELQEAPVSVKKHLQDVPKGNVWVLEDSEESEELANTYHPARGGRSGFTRRRASCRAGDRGKS
jgi:hypothetical protein